MQLEEYFLFEKFATGDRIRVQGTRIAIEHILRPYLEGDSPERIFHSYRHSLTLEQVYATITYYLHYTAAVDAYLEGARVGDEEVYQEYLRQEPPEVIQRLRALAAGRKSGTGPASP